MEKVKHTHQEGSRKLNEFVSQIFSFLTVLRMLFQWPGSSSM